MIALDMSTPNVAKVVVTGSSALNFVHFIWSAASKISGGRNTSNTNSFVRLIEEVCGRNEATIPARVKPTV